MYFSGYTVLYKYMEQNGHIIVGGLGVLPQGYFERHRLYFLHSDFLEPIYGGNTFI